MTVTRAAFNEAFAAAVKQAVKAWHHNIAPKHFKKGAARKYKYKKRSPKYTRKKNRKGLPPLVFSGRSRRQLLRPLHVIGNHKLVKGKFITNARVRHFWMTPPGHPKKGKELVTVAFREEQNFRRAVEEMTVENIEAIVAHKKRKVG